MVKYFTKKQLARFLGLPVSKLNTFDIHECPRGYSEQEVRRWVNENSIPVGDWKEIVAVGVGDDERVIWAECVYSALYACSPDTKALIVPASAVGDDLWDAVAARISGIFLISWGGETRRGHTHAATQEEAIELAWNTP